MGAIDDRLERGVAIFRRAGDDAALLGAALLAFHGALESYLDGELDGQANLGPQERELLGRGRLGWPARAQLAGRSGLLDQRQCELALAATRERLATGRGDACSWAAPEVQPYGRLVASGQTFRDAYRQIGEAVMAGRFVPDRAALSATHTGGLGALGLDTASAELDALGMQFDARSQVLGQIDARVFAR